MLFMYITDTVNTRICYHLKFKRRDFGRSFISATRCALERAIRCPPLSTGTTPKSKLTMHLHNPGYDEVYAAYNTSSNHTQI